jgi:hypothetical protein
MSVGITYATMRMAAIYVRLSFSTASIGSVSFIAIVAWDGHGCSWVTFGRTVNSLRIPAVLC